MYWRIFSKKNHLHKNWNIFTIDTFALKLKREIWLKLLLIHATSNILEQFIFVKQSFIVKLIYNKY